MRKTLLLLVVTFVLLESSTAQSSNETITTNFFAAFKSDPVKAYGDLFKDSKWVEKSDVETNKIKLGSLLKSLGDYHGFESITIKKAGESYVLKSFLLKFERQPIRFTFVLYRPDNIWTLQNVQYDSSVDTELEEAAKIDRLKENW